MSSERETDGQKGVNLEPKEAGNSAFVEALPNLFASHELQSFFRVTSQGVFVHEDVMGRLVETYQAWLKSKTDAQSEKSVQKCTRRLFDTEEPILYYLLDGKKCMTGYLMPGAVQNYQRLKIPYYGANLLDTSNYLHPRDQRITSLPHLKAELKAHEGLVFYVQLGERELSFSSEVLSSFAESARRSRMLIEEYPQLTGALREAIIPFVQVLERARPVSHKERLLVPQRYLNQSEFNFLRIGPLVVVLKGNRAVAGCYGLAGKSLSSLVRTELELLEQKPEGRRIGGLELAAGRKRRFLAKFDMQQSSFFIDYKAFYEFLKYLPKAHLSRKILPQRYTIKDCLEVFALFFSSAKPLESRKKTPPQKGKKKPAFSYRKTGSWTFVIDQENVILSCSERRMGKPGR
jgi:hypothetical protein